MAIDKMLTDAKNLGGEPDNIIIEPNEAYSLLKEAALNPDAYKGKLSVTRTGEEDENVALLWKNIFISKDQNSIKNMVNDWYKLKYRVTYSGVELKIVKPKEEEPKEIDYPEPPTVPEPRSVTGRQIPAPPKFPPNRIIRDDLSDMSGLRVCEKCGSSLKTKWIFFKSDKCIQPECDNYYKNGDPKQW